MALLLDWNLHTITNVCTDGNAHICSNPRDIVTDAYSHSHADTEPHGYANHVAIFCASSRDIVTNPHSRYRTDAMPHKFAEYADCIARCYANARYIATDSHTQCRTDTNLRAYSDLLFHWCTSCHIHDTTDAFADSAGVFTIEFRRIDGRRCCYNICRAHCDAHSNWCACMAHEMDSPKIRKCSIFSGRSS